MNDDSDILGEIFEGRTEIEHTERGATFGLSEETYYRLARCCMNAGAMGIEPAVIAKLGKGERGCKVTLFGKRHMFELVVRGSASGATIFVTAQRIAGLHYFGHLYAGDDGDAHWSRALRAMCAAEGIGYYDSWTAEQQVRQEED